MRIGSRARTRALAWHGLAALALALGCSSPAAQSEAPAELPADATLAELGEPYFRGLCASCHGAAGRGDGPAAAALSTPPADLTRIAARRGGRFPDGEIAQFIDGRFALPAHGSREMPVWGEVFTREIAADSGTAESISRGKVAVLVEYLKSIQVPAAGGASVPPPQAEAAAQVTRARMAEIFAAMRFLLPLSLDEQRFEDPEQSARVAESLALLDRSAQALASHGGAREVPFSHLARSLAIDARDIHARYEQGHVREARYLVQTLTETCVACHSRLPAVSDAPRSQDFMTDAEVLDLPLPQRAKLAYATRQFDEAQTLYEALFADRSVAAGDIDLEGHLDDYLELSIRVRRDPAHAEAALARFAARPDLSPALRGEVAHWRSALKALAQRGPVSDPVATARAEVGQVEALRPEQDERDALVDYLDASALLHRYLADGRPPRSEQADAYYLLGVIETRVGRSFWLSQAEAYLETAIRVAPGQPVARQSYALLEEFLTAGYSGSGGTHVPPDVREKLDELRRLSDGGLPAGGAS